MILRGQELKDVYACVQDVIQEREKRLENDSTELRQFRLRLYAQRTKMTAKLAQERRRENRHAASKEGG